jgi:hypothetical protein
MKLAARVEQLALAFDVAMNSMEVRSPTEEINALLDQAMIWSEAHIKWAGKFLPKQEAKDVQ